MSVKIIFQIPDLSFPEPPSSFVGGNNKPGGPGGNNGGGAGNGGFDDFDDLARRFEELKKIK